MTYRAGEVRYRDVPCEDDMRCFTRAPRRAPLSDFASDYQGFHAFNDHRGLIFVALTGVTGSFPRPG